MVRERPGGTEAPPEGEWAMFHERPFPARLDRALHGVAIGVAVIGAAVGGWYMPPAGAPIWAVSLAATIVGALAYGVARPLTMFATELYGLTRPKAYVLDWHQEPTLRQRRIKGAIFAAALLLLALFFVALDRFA